MTRGLNVLEQSMNRMAEVQAESGMVFSEIFNNIESARQTINQRDLEEQTIFAQQQLINSFDENQYNSEAFGQSVQDQKSLIESNKSLSLNNKRQLLRTIDEKSFDLNRQIIQREIALEEQEKFGDIMRNAHGFLTDIYDTGENNVVELEASGLNDALNMIENSDLNAESKSRAIESIMNDFNGFARSMEANTRGAELKIRDSKINTFINQSLTSAFDNNQEDLNGFDEIVQSTKQAIDDREDLTRIEREEFKAAIDSQSVGYRRGISGNINNRQKKELNESLNYDLENMANSLVNDVLSGRDLDQNRISEVDALLDDLDYSETERNKFWDNFNQQLDNATFENVMLEINNSINTEDESSINDGVNRLDQVISDIENKKYTGANRLKQNQLIAKAKQNRDRLRGSLVRGNTQFDRDMQSGIQSIEQKLSSGMVLNDEEIQVYDSLITNAEGTQYESIINNLEEIGIFSTLSYSERNADLSEMYRSGNIEQANKLRSISNELRQLEQSDPIGFYQSQGFEGLPQMDSQNPLESLLDPNFIQDRIDFLSDISESRDLPEDQFRILSNAESEFFNEYFKSDELSDNDRLSILQSLPLNETLINDLDFADTSGVSGYLISSAKKGFDIPVGVLAGQDINKDVLFNQIPRSSIEQNIQRAIRETYNAGTISDIETYNEMIINNTAYEFQNRFAGRDFKDRDIERLIEESMNKILPETVDTRRIWGVSHQTSIVKPHKLHTLNADDTISNIAHLFRDPEGDTSFIKSLDNVDPEFQIFDSNGILNYDTELLLNKIRKGDARVVPTAYNFRGNKTAKQYYTIYVGDQPLLVNEGTNAQQPFNFTIPVMQERNDLNEQNRGRFISPLSIASTGFELIRRQQTLGADLIRDRD